MGKRHSLAVSGVYPSLSTCLPTGIESHEQSGSVNTNLFACLCFPLPAWQLKPVASPKPNKYKH